MKTTAAIRPPMNQKRIIHVQNALPVGPPAIHPATSVPNATPVPALTAQGKR